ncbi:hypothetical protein KZ483_27800 [Paenibacillus sp. sptzw28]|uniref:hypothetical protein n=1 Tax=Paenibacillus sp. sptzw28 TaxID=715179 RepID=UPI001C6E02E0|nr:hypothetical protein [Paenibacillus sp. sptzw28]QYR21426.1 hypothetical protein KZ483_27800 [Paenibacillus sp. sptzw28]
MKKLKLIITILFTLSISFVAAFMYWNSDNQKDKRLWNQYKNALKTDNILEISYEGTGTTFSDNEKGNEIYWLKQDIKQVIELDVDLLLKG